MGKLLWWAVVRKFIGMKQRPVITSAKVNGRSFELDPDKFRAFLDGQGTADDLYHFHSSADEGVRPTITIDYEEQAMKGKKK